jgi:hypothetical protein
VIGAILSTVAAIGFAWVVACDYHGRAVRLGDVLARALGRALVAIGSSLVTQAAIVGIVLAAVAGGAVLVAGTPGGLGQGGMTAFLAIVLAVVAVLAVLILSIRWALAIPIIATEQVGPVDALRRSWHLTASAAWRTFGLLFVTVLVVGVLSALVSELLALVVVDLVSTAAGVALAGETLVDVLVAVLFAPVTGVILTVYLFDQRVRKDGWDVPLAEPARHLGR